MCVPECVLVYSVYYTLSYIVSTFDLHNIIIFNFSLQLRIVQNIQTCTVTVTNVLIDVHYSLFMICDSPRENVCTIHIVELKMDLLHRVQCSYKIDLLVQCLSHKSISHTKSTFSTIDHLYHLRCIYL